MAYIPKNKVIPKEKIKSMEKTNPDGTGMMVVIADTIFDTKWVDEWHIPTYFSLPFKSCLHFRTASSSNIGEEFCHPFEVNNKLWFMMNGNLFEFQSYFGYGFKKNETDAQRFNRQILQNLPSNFLDIPKIKKALELYLRSNFTKMIFMDSDGKVTILNEDLGEWVDGVWYSNGGIKDYIGYGYSGAYYYNKSDVRHKGGLITSQFLSERKRKEWSKCPYCQGYYKDLKRSICDGCMPLIKLLSYVEVEENGKDNC